jgi:hypothetical protein
MPSYTPNVHNDGDAYAPPGPFDRATSDLREHRDLLAARGVLPLDSLFDLMYRAGLHRSRGVELPDDTELELVRALPCLAGWCPLAAAEERLRRLPADAADSVVSPVHALHVRRRRSLALAGWLQVHNESNLAGKITDAAERLAVDQLTEVTADV